MKAKERFEVLLENMTGKIKAVAEGHSILLKGIQESREEAKKDNEETRAIFTVAIKDLYKKVDAVDKKVDAVDKKVDSVKQELSQKIDEVDKKVDKVDKKIDRIDQRLGSKIDKILEITEDHEERIKTLELIR